MKTIKMENALKDRSISKAVKSGSIIIYPTDTLYGIGCNAEVSESVRRIHEAKQRPEGKPFSVIVPSVDWIKENTLISRENLEFLENLFPGPYMAILKAKKAIPNVTSKEGTIGVRIPKNDFCDLIRKQGVVFLSTSVNLSDREPIFSIKDVPAPIRDVSDIAVDAGEIKGHGSRVFDLTKGFEIVRF